MDEDQDKKASREPYWDELDDKGKLERMRQIVKQTNHLIEFLENRVEFLMRHTHCDGKIVAPMHNTERSRSRNYLYF